MKSMQKYFLWMHASVILSALPSCVSAPIPHKLECLIEDCWKRENNQTLQQVRKGYDMGRARLDFDHTSFVPGIDQSLRLDCNVKVAGESSYSPIGHTALVWAIGNEICVELGGGFGAMNSAQVSQLKRIVEYSLKKYGLCSWMLNFANKEKSLSYLLRYRADDAEVQQMSHFVYLTLRMQEGGDGTRLRSINEPMSQPIEAGKGQE